MSTVASYFDLRRTGDREVLESTTAKGVKDSNALAASLPQYVALALGVLVQPFYDTVRAGTKAPSSFTWQLAAFSLIVAAMIFPAVYRASWNTEQPRFVQYCSIFAAGVGWQSLIKMGTTPLKAPVPANPGATTTSALMDILSTVISYLGMF